MKIFKPDKEKGESDYVTEASDFNGMRIKPNQEPLFRFYCKNKHYLCGILMSPYVIVNLKAKCRVCGTEAEWENGQMNLEIKK